MEVLLYSLLGLFIVALLAGWIRDRILRRKLERGEIEEMPGIQKAHADDCCGQHDICEKESLLAAVSQEVEYYDDEELDVFRGRQAHEYTAEEVERFEDVLDTMREEEVAGWVRSLQLRGITLPDPIREEVFLIVGEFLQEMRG